MLDTVVQHFMEPPPPPEQSEDNHLDRLAQLYMGPHIVIDKLVWIFS